MTEQDVANTGEPLDAGAEQTEAPGDTGSTILARANDVLPAQIHLLPVAARPFFPGQAVPLLMDAEHWAATLQAVGEAEHRILGVVLVDGDASEQATFDDFRKVGTVCRVHRVHQQDGHLQVLVECLQRFRLDTWVSRKAPFSARVTYIPEPAGPPDDQVTSPSRSKRNGTTWPPCFSSTAATRCLRSKRVSSRK